MHHSIRSSNHDNKPSRRTRRTSKRPTETRLRISAVLSAAELRREVIAILG